MIKHLFLTPLIALILVGCSSEDRNTKIHNEQKAKEILNPDNTGKNIRDRNSENLTAGDQSENSEDREITQKIRKAIINDEAISTNGKNIKIITVKKIITLRGPVNSESEKRIILEKARATGDQVHDQLEVLSNR